MLINDNFKNDLNLKYLNLLASYGKEEEFDKVLEVNLKGTYNFFKKNCNYVQNIVANSRNKQKLSEAKAILSFANRQKGIKM